MTPLHEMVEAWKADQPGGERELEPGRDYRETACRCGATLTIMPPTARQMWDVVRGHQLTRKHREYLDRVGLPQPATEAERQRDGS